jgi:hypothetical protein
LALITNHGCVAGWTLDKFKKGSLSENQALVHENQALVHNAAKGCIEPRVTDLGMSLLG